jgi:dTMP kinase
MNGLFVTFEGIDGCGKSTQVDRARAALQAQGIACCVTREPGGTPIGERIRSLLLSIDNREMCNACEVLLYLAARAQHVAETIVPALAKGEVVLCDRFMDATLAYQGYGRGIGLELLMSMNSFATGGIVPGLTFVFDIDTDTAMRRLKKAGKPPDRLEGNAREFHEAVRKGYLALTAHYPDRMRVVKGDSPADDLSRTVVADITGALRRGLS